jgi:tetratricopeptide (TPR) repeat protein
LRYAQPYVRALARFRNLERRLSEERRRAAELAGRLTEGSFEQQRLLVRNSPKHLTWGVAERLILDSHLAIDELGGDASYRLARAAVLVSDHLDGTVYGQRQSLILRAASRAHLGNALRLCGDYETPRAAFAAARALLESAAADDTEMAQLASFESSWLWSLGHWERAVSSIDDALIQLSASAPRLRRDLLVKRAGTLAELRPREAIAAYRAALDEISVAESRRLAIMARQGLAVTLCYAGLPNMAAEPLRQAEQLVDGGDRKLGLLLSWARGLAALCGGEPASACESLREVWATTTSHREFAQRLVLVSLDLLSAYRTAGRHAEAHRLGHRVEDVLSEGSPRPAVVEGWREVWRRLGPTELTPKNLHDFRRFFWLAWNDPHAKLVLPT